MREIKFRVFDRVDKKMHYRDGCSSFLDIAIWPVVWSEYIKNGIRKKSDILAMQYTGLKDKNGKEIYEGDIVKIHNFEREFKRMEKPENFNVFTVEFNRYTYAFDNETDYMPLTDYDTSTLEPYEMEVLGNIYENPELLNSK